MHCTHAHAHAHTHTHIYIYIYIYIYTFKPSSYLLSIIIIKIKPMLTPFPAPPPLHPHHQTGAENGATLESDEEIETKHTSAANSAANSSAQVASADSNVNEHFVAFVEHNGGVYEMDGRRGGGKDSSTERVSLARSWEGSVRNTWGGTRTATNSPSLHCASVIELCGT